MTAGIAYPADYNATYSGPQYTANQGRTALAAAMGGATSSRPLGGISGVRPGTPTTTVTATSTTWTAAAFGGYIDTAASATNGGYYFSFPSGGTGSVTAAAASARIDLIYVQLSDVNTGDGTTVAPKVDVLYLAGTAGSGVPPATPARSFAIAQINVPATGGGSPTVTWIAPYTIAAGGIVPFNTAAQMNAYTPALVGDKATVFADSTPANNAVYRWNGSAWKAWESDWISYTMSTTAVTLGTGGTIVAEYKYTAGMVFVRFAITFGSGGAMSSNPTFSLPVAAVAAAHAFQAYSGRGSAMGSAGFSTIAAMDFAVDNTGTTTFRTYSGNYVPVTSTSPHTWASGSVLQGEFTYKAA